MTTFACKNPLDLLIQVSLADAQLDILRRSGMPSTLESSHLSAVNQELPADVQEQALDLSQLLFFKCANRECANLRGQPGKPRSIYCSPRCQSREQNLRQGRIKHARAPRRLGRQSDHLHRERRQPRYPSLLKKQTTTTTTTSSSKTRDSRTLLISSTPTCATTSFSLGEFDQSQTNNQHHHSNHPLCHSEDFLPHELLVRSHLHDESDEISSSEEDMPLSPLSSTASMSISPEPEREY